jgi:hypothetical protein
LFFIALAIIQILAPYLLAKLIAICSRCKEEPIPLAGSTIILLDLGGRLVGFSFSAFDRLRSSA